MMLWHVQDRQEVTSLESGVMMKYRTTNRFLKSYGGNLKNLFSDHFPIGAGIGSLVFHMFIFVFLSWTEESVICPEFSTLWGPRFGAGQGAFQRQIEG